MTSRRNTPVPMWKSLFWLGTSALVSITSSFATKPINWLKDMVVDLDGQGADPLGRRGAELRLKLASESAWAHCYDFCQCAHIQLASKMRSCPSGKIPHAFIFYLLLLSQQLAVLCLVARTSQEKH